jgi:hypothetical protein
VQDFLGLPEILGEFRYEQGFILAAFPPSTPKKVKQL